MTRQGTQDGGRGSDLGLHYRAEDRAPRARGQLWRAAAGARGRVAAAITVTTASPLGAPERAIGRRLPLPRLAVALVTDILAGKIPISGTTVAIISGRNIATQRLAEVLLNR